MGNNFGFQTAAIDIDRSSEFTGDDVDQFSSLVNLGCLCNKVIIESPTLTSTALNIYVQKDGEVDTVPIILHSRKISDESTGAWATTAGTTANSIVCDCLGGYKFIRIRATSNQTADREFKVCGIKN